MGSNAPTDAELVADALAGDAEAFGRLYDRHARSVRAVVVAVSGDWPAVEDMTQESFLRGYRKLAGLRDAERFGPWITGIARQVARERRRTLRRDRHEFRDPQSAGMSSVERDGAAAGSDAALEDREQMQRVMEQLGQLPERERLAIHAFYFQERDPRQAAALLELSRSGFYALLQRAVAKLAARLQSDELEHSHETQQRTN